MDQQYPSPSAPSQVIVERELPMLAGIASFFRWCEELLNILNGPVLMFGAGIALVDLLTDGALTTDITLLLFAWAGSQALGIDIQLLGCFARARQALRHGHYGTVVGWVILGAILGFATWQAGYVYIVQQSQHITEAQALAQIGMAQNVWLAWRVGLAVGLVALAGWTRYVAPGKNVAVSTAEEAERLRAEIELAPLRAQAQVAKIRNARGAVMTALGREQQQQPAKPAFRAAYVAPQTQPPQEHIPAGHADTYRAMHDGYGDEDDLVTDEVLDEIEDDSDLFSTLEIPAVHLNGAGSEAPDTSSAKRSTRKRANSGPAKVNLDRAKAVREYNRKLKVDAKAQRRAAIRDAVYAILDDWQAGGRVEQISDRELARRVAKRVDFPVNPSGNTVARWRGPWQSSRAHKAALDLEQLEQTQPPIVSDEVMTELEMAEALP